MTGFSRLLDLHKIINTPGYGSGRAALINAGCWQERCPVTDMPVWLVEIYWTVLDEDRDEDSLEDEDGTFEYLAVAAPSARAAWEFVDSQPNPAVFGVDEGYDVSLHPQPFFDNIEDYVIHIAK